MGESQRLLRWYLLSVPRLYKEPQRVPEVYDERQAIRKLTFRRYPTGPNTQTNLVLAADIFNTEAYKVLDSGVEYGSYFDPALLNTDIRNIKDTLEPPASDTTEPEADNE